MVGRFRREVTVSGLRLELASLDQAAEWSSGLTSEETRRAEGMTNPVLRARFAVSRGLRRKVLAEVLPCGCGDVSIVEDEGTKPRLLDGQGWDFNVSHAGDYVAVVVGRGEVGVDLEKVRPVRDMAALMARYFHRDEVAAWQALSAEQKSAAFFLLWSAREAAMKCAGTGLAAGMGQTRIDPAILRSDRAEGVVGTKNMILQREKAPEGYVLVTARTVA